MVTSEVLGRVFSVEADIVTDTGSGVPLCIPYGLRRAHGEIETKPTRRGILR
jgi:iron complex transport system ATP-binding protein